MSSLPALDKFLKIYHQAYLDKLGESPRYYPQGEDSLCIEGAFDYNEHSEGMNTNVLWHPVKREDSVTFENVESALDIKLHPNINGLF